jgi:hypothetical protein
VARATYRVALSLTLVLALAPTLGVASAAAATRGDVTGRALDRLLLLLLLLLLVDVFRVVIAAWTPASAAGDCAASACAASACAARLAVGGGLVGVCGGIRDWVGLTRASHLWSLIA